MKVKKEKALGGRIWAALLSFGLIGQIAWVVENMYFNVFLYNTITGDAGMIAAMVAASAVVAAVTTLDCVMTFFGSSANDAAFNAWVTDVTGDGNRGRVESVLAIMPLLAMLVVFGLLDGFTLRGQWWLFFLIVGALTMLGGGLGHVLIQEPANLRRAGGNYAANVFYGLRPGVSGRGQLRGHLRRGAAVRQRGQRGLWPVDRPAREAPGSGPRRHLRFCGADSDVLRPAHGLRHPGGDCHAGVQHGAVRLPAGVDPGPHPAA